MVWSGSSPTHKLRAGRTARLTRVTRVTASVVTLNSLSACRSSRHIHGLSCQSERSVRKSFPSKFENKSSSTEATRSMCRVQIISVSARTERKSNRELWSRKVCEPCKTTVSNSNAARLTAHGHAASSTISRSHAGGGIVGAASATNAQGGAGSTATKSGVLAHATGTSDGVFLSRRVGACTAATYRRERDSVDTNGLGRPRSAREKEKAKRIRTSNDCPAKDA